MSALPALVVFSHLRWDFVFQRPQHLLSRMAEYFRVYFIEEPIHDLGPARFAITSPLPNLKVCQPHTSVLAPGFDSEQMPALHGLLERLVAQEAIHDAVAWLYTPLALALARALRPIALVYDCMDELSAFMNAPAELTQREAALLQVADLVFTGGPSIFRSKKDRNRAVYCLPSSVDAAHFSGGAKPGASHLAQAHIGAPRLGFYGVIDERLDLNLLAAVAAARPDWQIVMVGPVVKIDPAGLPRRHNIHYLGQQSYLDLPAFLAGWNVCLMPFALNSATQFISPTKTLEYMAASKPIVSTAVADVAAPYGHVVRVAHSVEEFIAASEASLALTSEQRSQMQRQMWEILSRTSWDATATRMRELIREVTVRRRKTVALSPGGGHVAARISASATMGVSGVM